MDLSILTNWLLAGTGAAGGWVVINKFVDFISGRLGRREDQVVAAQARIDTATHELILALQRQVDAQATQITAINTELEECRANHAHAQEEIARLRGLVHGLGDARQSAQRIVSEAVIELKDDSHGHT